MISLERKRTERSGNPFLLMLLDAGSGLPSDKSLEFLQKILSALASSTRETDVMGWCRNNSVVGVMFTEITIEDKKSILSAVLSRVNEALRSKMSLEQFGHINISFHLFPDDWDQQTSERATTPILSSDLLKWHDSRKLSHGMKRIMDIVG